MNPTLLWFRIEWSKPSNGSEGQNSEQTDHGQCGSPGLSRGICVSAGRDLTFGTMTSGSMTAQFLSDHTFYFLF